MFHQNHSTHDKLTSNKRTFWRQSSCLCWKCQSMLTCWKTSHPLFCQLTRNAWVLPIQFPNKLTGFGTNHPPQLLNVWWLPEEASWRAYRAGRQAAKLRLLQSRRMITASMWAGAYQPDQKAEAGRDLRKSRQNKTEFSPRLHWDKGYRGGRYGARLH